MINNVIVHKCNENNSNDNNVPKKGMTSLEISEATGKQHAHVMRDIRSLIDQGVNASNFGLVEYTDKKGEKRPMYNLTAKGCLILASGYDAVLREKIIDRLEAVETGQAQPLYQVKQTKPKQKSVSASKKRVEALGAWLNLMTASFNLNDYSKYKLLKQEADLMMFPMPDAPKSEGAVERLGRLLKKFKVMNGKKEMSAKAFNPILIEKGFLRVLSRKNSDGTDESYKNFTEKGLEFGMNKWNEYSSTPTTEPWFYIDKFPELLKLLGLYPQAELF